jgi:hypothetical protein
LVQRRKNKLGDWIWQKRHLPFSVKKGGRKSCDTSVSHGLDSGKWKNAGLLSLKNWPILKRNQNWKISTLCFESYEAGKPASKQKLPVMYPMSLTNTKLKALS